MAGRFSIEAIFTAKDRFAGVMGSIEAKLGKFAGGASAQLAKLDKFSSRAARGVTSAAVGIAAGGAAIGAALYATVQAGADLEHTLVAAGAKFGSGVRRGTAEYEQLRLAAEKIGSTTEFSAQQAGAAEKDLGAAGLNIAQALGVLPGVVNLATAAEIELSDASTIATQSLGAFNLMTEDSAQLTLNFNRVMDTMSKTADMTTADMQGLFEAIREGGPVATSTGASVETFLATAGQLAQAGIVGSVAGTTLKDMFLRLASPTTEAAAALQHLGIKTEDAKGNMLDILDVLDALQKKTAKMGTATKAETLEQIFGKIPIAGVTSLLNAGIDKVRDYRTQLEGAGGSLSRMAGIMRDDTKGELDRFVSSLRSVRDALFNVVKVPLSPLLTGLTSWVQTNREVVRLGAIDALDKARFAFDLLANGLRRGAGAAMLFITPLVRVVQLFGGAETWPVAVNQLGFALGLVVPLIYATSAAAKLARVALFGVEIATKGVTAAIWLANTATKVGTAATWLANAARGAWALVTQAAAAVETFFIGEIVAGTAATEAATGSMVAAEAATASLALTIGAAVAAVGALVLAWNQWQGLQKASGGHAWAAISDVLHGDLSFSRTNAAMNEDARREAQKTAADGAPMAAGGFVPAGAIPPINAPGLGSDEAPGEAPDQGAPALPPSAQGPQAEAAQAAQLGELIALLKANAEKDGKSVVELRIPQGVQAEVKTPKAGVRNPVRVTPSGGPR